MNRLSFVAVVAFTAIMFFSPEAEAQCTLCFYGCFYGVTFCADNGGGCLDLAEILNDIDRPDDDDDDDDDNDSDNDNDQVALRPSGSKSVLKEQPPVYLWKRRPKGPLKGPKTAALAY